MEFSVGTYNGALIAVSLLKYFPGSSTDSYWISLYQCR